MQHGSFNPGRQDGGPAQEFHERRSHRRLRLSRPVCMEIVSCPAEPALKKTRLTGSTYDISAGGLAIIITTQAVPKGSRLHVDLLMQGEHQVFHLAGTVMRSEPFETPGFYEIAVKLQQSMRHPLKNWQKFVFDSLRAFDQPS